MRDDERKRQAEGASRGPEMRDSEPSVYAHGIRLSTVYLQATVLFACSDIFVVTPSVQRHLLGSGNHSLNSSHNHPPSPS